VFKSDFVTEDSLIRSIERTRHHRSPGSYYSEYEEREDEQPLKLGNLS